jgi:hypothetical protein
VLRARAGVLHARPDRTSRADLSAGLCAHRALVAGNVVVESGGQRPVSAAGLFQDHCPVVSVIPLA